MRLTRQGLLVSAAAFAVVVVGRILGMVELYAIGATMGLLVASCGIWVRLRGIDLAVRRTVRPHRVHAGNPCTVEVELANTARRSTPVLRVLDPVTRTAGADLLVPPIIPRKRELAAYRLPTTTRGLLTVGPMTVEVADPFGLTRSRVQAAPAAEVTVLPRVDDVAPMPRTVGPDPDGSDRTGSLGRVGEDFAALRPYIVGDDLRRVHWPSSARTDDLLVRQNDVPWQGRLTVLLDLRREHHDTETLERAVSAAASIARSHLRRGDHVRLVTTDGYDTGFGLGGAHLDGMLEYLAVVQRSGRGSLRSGLELVERGASGALVVVSGRPGDDDLETIETTGVGHQTRFVVRFDSAGNVSTARGTAVLGVAGGATFVQAWSAAAAGRGARSRRPRTRAASGTASAPSQGPPQHPTSRAVR